MRYGNTVQDKKFRKEEKKAMISYTTNRDHDMNHVKTSGDLNGQLGSSQSPHGVFGDSVGGRSFSAEQSAILEDRSKQVRSVGAGWHKVWAGPGCTCWTIIDCRPNTQDEIDVYEEAFHSEID